MQSGDPAADLRTNRKSDSDEFVFVNNETSHTEKITFEVFIKKFAFFAILIYNTLFRN